MYRSQGSWIAAFPLGVVNGRRRTKRSRHPTERAALVALERMRRLYGAGGTPATGTVAQYLSEWLAGHSRGVRSSTHTSYEGHVRLHINPVIGGVPLSKLRKADVNRVIADLERKGRSAGTIERVITTLRVALNAAVADHTITDSPARTVVLPANDPKPVHVVTIDEADRIIEAVRGHWVEHVVRLLLGSGMRIGEALGLNQGDAILEAQFVRVRVTKTRYRAIGITEDATDAIREAIAKAPRVGSDEPIFFGERTGDRMRTDSVTHVLPRLLEPLGIRLTPHGLRHGAATLMLSAGYDIQVIRSQLGHRSPNITTRYAHVVPALQRAALGALERKKAP